MVAGKNNQQNERLQNRSKAIIIIYIPLNAIQVYAHTSLRERGMLGLSQWGGQLALQQIAEDCDKYCRKSIIRKYLYSFDALIINDKGLKQFD